MCLWKDDNRPKNKRCRHGHRHHEVLYNWVIPSEPPVVWCNAPECWTICAYGENSKVHRGFKALIIDFFCASDEQIENSHEWYSEKPSIQRGQTFTEFNKARYPGYSPNHPSALETPASTTKSSYFLPQETILDIRAAKPSVDHLANSQSTLAAQDKPSYRDYTEPLYSRVERPVAAAYPVEVTEAQNNMHESPYSPSLESRTVQSHYSSGAVASTVHLNHVPHVKTVPPPQGINMYSIDSGYSQPTALGRGGDLYERDRQYFESIRTDSNQPVSRLGQGQYSSYTSQSPEYHRRYNWDIRAVNDAPYSLTTDPYSHQYSSKYSSQTQVPQTSEAELSTRRAPQTKPKPAYSEYSPDVQALLGTQAAGRYPSYSPYEFPRKMI